MRRICRLTKWDCEWTHDDDDGYWWTEIDVTKTMLLEIPWLDFICFPTL